MRNTWFDAMRAVSALLVCLAHVRVVFLVDYSSVIAPGLFLKIFYLLTGLGHQAVIIFFVLSGYLVGGSVIRSGVNFRWLPYLLSRITRLWVVLIPALAATAAIDLAIGRVDPEILTGSMRGVWNSGPDSEYSSSIMTFFGNVVFLQGVLVPTFGSNGPLWSLAYEFWYYVVFPLGFAAFTRPDVAPINRLALAILTLLLLWVLPFVFLQYFIIWLFGCIAFWSVQRFPGSPHMLASLVTGFLFLLFVLLSAVKSGQFAALSGYAGDLGIGVVIAILCHLFGRARAFRAPRWIAGSIELLSDTSYSLYLVHFPLVVLVAAVLGLPVRVQPSLFGLTEILGTLILLVIIGQCFWLAFERHTLRVRQNIARQIF